MRNLWTASLLLPLLALSACVAETDSTEDTGEAASPLVTSWTVIGGSTDVAPAPVTFLNKIFLFARGIGDAKGYVRISSDGTNWSAWGSLPGTLSTDAGLAPVVFSGKLYVFARSTTDNGIYVNTTTDGTSWSGWFNPFSGTTNTAVAPVVFNGKLYVFAKGIGDNTVYVTNSTNGTSWTTWLGIPGTTNVAPAAAVLNNELLLFEKGIGDNAIYLSTSTNGTLWSSWSAFGGTTATGVRTAVFAGDLYVTAVGLGDHRVYTTVSRDLSHWSGFFELPPMSHTTDTAVGATAWNDGLFWFSKGDTGDTGVYDESTPIYHLPFTSGAGWNMGNGNWDDPGGGHGFGQAYAFDFGHAEGATVVAMRAGTVISMANDRTCNVWNVMPGDPCYGAPGEGNYALIRHADGTVAAYDHMQFGTVSVSVGTVVAQGTPIGKSGNTGNSSTPHLHVDVRQFWTSPSTLGPTVPIYFTDIFHVVWRPRDGDTLAP